MTKKIKLKMSQRLVKKKMRRSGFGMKKHCRFCGNAEYAKQLDYKNSIFLRNFLTERGKILPSRISGNCGLHQREMSNLVRKARVVALLPFTAPYY